MEFQIFWFIPFFHLVMEYFFVFQVHGGTFMVCINFWY